MAGFAELVCELGGDPDVLLHDAGLGRDALGDPELMISLHDVAQLMESAARQTATPTFGLRHGALHSPEMLGVLAVAIQNAATVDEAVRTASRYLFMHSPAYELVLENPSRQLPGCVTLRFDAGFEGPVPQRQLIDGCLASIYRILGVLLVGKVPLRAVSIPHTPTGRQADYRSHFAAPVFFAQPYPALHLDDGVLARNMGPVKPLLREQAIAYIKVRHPPAGPRVTDSVRSALKSTVGATRGTKADIAELLELQPRTLQRQLAAEGVSFEALREEVYRAATLRLLRETDISLSQVAAVLGFSEQSAMTRSVRRWFGTTPKNLRATAATP